MSASNPSRQTRVQPGVISVKTDYSTSQVYGDRIKVGDNDVLYPTEAGKIALTSDVEKVEAKIPSIEGLASETYVNNALTGYATED